MRGRFRHQVQEKEAGDEHRSDPVEITENALTKDMLVDIEADRFVFRFLHRMPEPKRCKSRIGLGNELLPSNQQGVGEDRGERRAIVSQGQDDLLNVSELFDSGLFQELVSLL